MSWKDLPGWFDFADIYDQAVEEAQQGAVFVEVGVAFGRSLAYLARRAIDSGKQLEIWAVDLWSDDPGWGGEYRALVELAGGPYMAFESGMREHAPGERDLVDVLRYSSADAATMFTDGDCDLVFIDACHDFEAVKADIAAWLPKVRSGGVIAGHDHEAGEFPGVVRAVREAFGDDGYEVRGTSWWRRVP